VRILQINAVYKEKSTGRTTYELEQYLRIKGWECYAAYSDGPDKPSNFIRLGGLNAHRIHCRLARWFGLQGFFSPFSANKVIRYIDEIQPDVVHLRNLHDNYLSIMPVLDHLAKEQIPTAVTLHDFFLFTGGCCFHTDFECRRWITGECGRCPQMREESLFDFSRYVQKKKLKAFSKMSRLAVIGVSQWATNEFVASGKLPRAVTKTIYNWVDFHTFRYRKVAKKVAFRDTVQETDFVILGVATGWNDIKGLDSFLRLSKKLLPDCKIVLVGAVPKRQVLPDNVIGLGIITDPKVLAECYCAADVFVSFSARETFGKVIAEAMSCGCPTVVYDVTACGEVAGTDCGYRVKLGDVDAAWEKISLIRKNGRAAYQDKCLERSRKLFDLQKNAQEYAELYEELCR